MNEKRKKEYIFVIICVIMCVLIIGGTLSQTALAEEGEANTITNSPVITVLVNGENNEKEWTNNEVQQSFVEQLCANGREKPIAYR